MVSIIVHLKNFVSFSPPPRSKIFVAPPAPRQKHSSVIFGIFFLNSELDELKINQLNYCCSHWLYSNLLTKEKNWHLILK